LLSEAGGTIYIVTVKRLTQILIQAANLFVTLAKKELKEAESRHVP